MSRYNPQYFKCREVCPVCEAQGLETLYTCALTDDPVRSLLDSHYRAQGYVKWEWLEGTDYVVCSCNDCGLIFQRHVPTEALLCELYDGMIAPKPLARLEARRLTVDNFEQIGGELSLLFRRLGKHPTEVSFLDYGFGHGRWARVAAAMGATVYATEISPEKIAMAAGIGVRIIDDSALDTMRFDIVHTEQVFEHLTDPARDFRRLSAALKPGGLMKVAVPPRGRIGQRLQSDGMIGRSPQEAEWNAKASRLPHLKDYVSILPLEHLNAYSAASIEHLARQNAMQVISRVRRQSVAISASSAGDLVRSLFRLAKVSLRPLVARNAGYFLLAAAHGSQPMQARPAESP